MSDLECAVEPSVAPTVFALYGFQDLAEQLESLLEIEGEELVTEITDRFVRAGSTRAVHYDPRHGDFCSLFAGRLKDVQRVLNRTVRDIDRHASKLGLRVVVGVVELPTEADTPGVALDLADKRRSEGISNLRAPARRSLSARVSSTVGIPPEPAVLTNEAGWRDQPRWWADNGS